MPPAPRFVRHAGIAAPFLRPHVELEEIAPLVPGLHLHAHGPGALAPQPHQHSPVPEPNHHPGLHCFEGLRYRADGSEHAAFVLNQVPYRNASILIAGEQFGAGSLQAFAVMRLLGCGMRAVIAPSFGPVFYDDCVAFGLLPVTLAASKIASLARTIAADPALATTVDLDREVIERPGLKPIPFSVHPRLRANLLLGRDNLDEVLEHRREAERFEQENRRRRPWMYQDDVTR
jgi:3-isopropylmalate/(R)-2-methylmalate dehydratase small subunit